MTIILINSGKPEALRELRRVSHEPMAVITEARYAAFYESIDDIRFVKDISDIAEVRDVAFEIRKREGVTAVISPSDRSMLTGGFLRSLWGLPGESFEVSNRFTNKAIQKRVLQAAGIPVARFECVANDQELLAAIETVQFPIIAKPAFGTGTMGVMRLDTSSDISKLTRALSELPSWRGSLLLEEFVQMRGEYSCDGIVQDGVVVAVVVSRYHQPLLGLAGGMVGGTTLDPLSEHRPVLERLHQRVVTALGLSSGVTHMEAYLTDQGFVVGEIASRPGGAGVPKNAERAQGLDLWQAFMLSALGEDNAPAVSGDHELNALYMWTTLPSGVGTITSISVGGIETMREVEEVDMKAKVGDSLQGELHSSFTTGHVFLKLPFGSEEQIMSRLAEVEANYHLELTGALD